MKSQQYILTFLGFPFPVAALWDPADLLSLAPDRWGHEGLDKMRLVTEEHRSTPLADRDLASIVRTVFQKAQESGTIAKIASFSGPGPLTSIRASMALLDGLDVGSLATAYRADFFHVLLSRHRPVSQEIWAIDNGRQAWWTGRYVQHTTSQTFNLSVEENVTHGCLESLGGEATVKMIWIHTPIEDILCILKQLALYVLQEEYAEQNRRCDLHSRSMGGRQL